MSYERITAVEVKEKVPSCHENSGAHLTLSLTPLEGVPLIHSPAVVVQLEVC